MYRSIMQEYRTLKTEIVKVKQGLHNMDRDVSLADLGLRGYMFHHDDKLLIPYDQAMVGYKSNLADLRNTLEKLGFDLTYANIGEKAVNDYLTAVRQMVTLAKAGKNDEVLDFFKEDRGYEAWLIYNRYTKAATNYVEDLERHSESDFQRINRDALILQIIIILLAFPVILITDFRLQRNKKHRIKLYKEIEDSNTNFVFNPVDENLPKDEDSIKNRLIENLKKAATFIKNISSGNYDVQWDGMTEENTKVNENNLAGELIKMRDKMKRVRAEDEQRIWMTEGLSTFSEIVRKHQNNFEKLSEAIISNLVNYLKAKQGGLFILNDDNEHDKYLQLMASYAYERKKFLERRIDIGDGLIGQCYLEGETVYLTKLPGEYVYITSGLGDARPRSLLIIPLKTNEKVEGIIEIASLNLFEAHEIEFLEKLGETIASAIVSVRTNDKTKQLLAMSQEQAEEMRAQEEEMRQNMEELQATQEEMSRKNSETLALNHAVDQSIIRIEYTIDGKITNVNKRFTDLMGVSKEELLDKQNTDFIPEEDLGEYAEYWREVVENGKSVTTELRCYDADKEIKYMLATLTPLIDRNSKVRKVYFLGQDITKNKRLELETKQKTQDLEKKEESLRKNMEEMHTIQAELSKEKYLLDAMLNNIPDSIYFKDQESRFIRISSYMTDKFGVKETTEVIGKSDFDFFGKEHAQKAFQDEQNIMKENKPVIDIVEKETYDDGSVSWVSTTKMPLKNEEGHVVGTFGISRDITRLKQLEEAVNERDKKLRKEEKEYEAQIKALSEQLKKAKS
ncbi:MAG: PAS domain-containing protein [Cyclobacteriaceae bacterium]